MLEKILFATTNENKLREAQEILGIEVEGVKVEVDEIQTLDPKECAVKKATTVFEKCQRSVLVEDTALFFEAWNGLPGVFTSYFLETVGNEGLIRMLGKSNRQAKAQTTLVLYRGERDYQIFTGVLEGTISEEPRGKYGFGWDPIFIPAGFDRTLAEMCTEEKNKISMRRKALENLRQTMDAS